MRKKTTNILISKLPKHPYCVKGGIAVPHVIQYAKVLEKRKPRADRSKAFEEAKEEQAAEMNLFAPSAVQHRA